ncbi:large ribosomal subunit protein uL4m isoform X2 [Agelaius tricolor]|uniref:large ribosomal subunit protein uL4m isoform X2 n=1 Tax=Agelaius tricolor TaxID=9191 RepID=UPI0039F22150
MIRAGAAALRAWSRGRGWAALSTAPPAPPATPETRKGLSPEEPPVASPVLRSCSVPVPSPLSPVQAWVGSLRHPQDALRGLADLHPDVFAVTPRLDILHTVATWQRNFRRISHARVRTRAEVRGGGRKPWRQKGSGRARHGSIRSPLWRGGGIAHGPRGPTSYFYMVPMRVRVLALKVALSVKLMQDELHLVESLELPSSDPQELLELARARRWGHSVLVVDTNEFPENISAVAEGLKSITLIPALGLNVHSLLKHRTLVLTLDAVTFLEQRLLWHDSRYAPLVPLSLPHRDPPPGCLSPPWVGFAPSGWDLPPLGGIGPSRVGFVPPMGQDPAPMPSGKDLGTQEHSEVLSPLHVLEPPRVGFAPLRCGICPPWVGFTPPRVEFAPLRCGICPSRVGFAPPGWDLPPSGGICPPWVGFTPLRCGICPSRMGFAPPGWDLPLPGGIYPSRMGFAPPPDGICPPWVGFAPPGWDLPLPGGICPLRPDPAPPAGNSGLSGAAVAVKGIFFPIVVVFILGGIRGLPPPFGAPPVPQSLWGPPPKLQLLHPSPLPNIPTPFGAPPESQTLFQPFLLLLLLLLLTAGFPTGFVLLGGILGISRSWWQRDFHLCVPKCPQVSPCPPTPREGGSRKRRKFGKNKF